MSSTDDLLEDLLSWEGPSATTPLRGLTSPKTPINVAVSAAPSPAKAGAAASVAPAGEKRSLVLPPALHDRLMPHQREGVQWLYGKHCWARACLLADEMGLGKTVQVCALLGELYRRREVRTTIIVVPPTLAPLWERALLDWGDLDRKIVEVVHADSRARRAARWKRLSYGLPCVMITTYGVLRQDATAMSATMVDYVVLDEAHLIRNATSHAFEAALMLSARHKIALTGTPLMNSFEDLWSVFRFLDGGIIGVGKAGFSAISATLLRGNERDASGAQLAAASSELARLQAAIRPFMLRREKRDLGVVGSTKHDTVVWVRLTDTQRVLYQTFLGTEEVARAVRPTPAGGGGGGDGDAADAPDSFGDVTASERATGAGASPLLLLTTLSQVCNHPWLQLTDEAFSDALARPVSEVPLAEVGSLLSGAKLPVALALLQHCAAGGRKSLVFSRSKRLLAMLARLLEDAGVRHTRVDGDIASVPERVRAVEAFNADPSVAACLMTTQVGGVGLTFESASCVILLDPSWNPSADAQAVDRAHRIGQQSEDVLVFRLVTCGTVEEKVYRNQIFKTMAAKQSLQAADGGGDEGEGEGASRAASESLFRYFTRVQLRSMFELGDMDESETARQLERLHPNRVAGVVRAAVAGVAGVCATSDNGAVLHEAVTAETSPDAEVGVGDWGVSGRKRERSSPRSPSPVRLERPARVDWAAGAGQEVTLTRAEGPPPASNSAADTPQGTGVATERVPEAGEALSADTLVGAEVMGEAPAHDVGGEPRASCSSARSSHSFADCVDVGDAQDGWS